MNWGFQQALEARRAEQLSRTATTFYGSSRHPLRDAEREYLNFSSNDYLGLAGSTELQAAMIEGVKKAGVGSGAAHLVCGHHEFHQALEESLAAWLGREAALVFSTGYMANLAVVSTLIGRGDYLFEDKLNHASLIDGARLSQAKTHRFNHSDLNHLKKRLDRHLNADSNTASRALIATDAVFSMDGDLAEMKDLVQLQSKYPRLMLMADDAHGIGVLGEQGAGTMSLMGLSEAQVPVLVGTLGKALGTSGAFVAGSADMIEYLRQFARPFIYTTAAAPALAYASLEAIRLAQKSDRRDRLRSNLSYFKECASTLDLPILPSSTPIQPLMLGSPDMATRISQELKQAGFWVSAIRPPTVPQGTSRLRITLTSVHTKPQIDQLLDHLNQLVKEENLDAGIKG